MTNPTKPPAARSFLPAICIGGLLVLLLGLFGSWQSSLAADQKQIVTEKPAYSSPVAQYGQLQVAGNRIVGQDGGAASLAGPSFFWSNSDWEMARFYNREAVEYFADDWNAGIVRAAIAAQHDGSYLDQPEQNYARAEAIIDGAIANGIYVIVDWHTHQAEQNVAEAVEFFQRIARKYGHTPNLIYEIYNEPLDTTDWALTVKPYAEQLIQAIREIDPDNLIIVGTQSWGQDVDKAAADPIRGHRNIAYSLHFYAATHGRKYRQRAKRAIAAGLPIIVTEWGSVDHTGDGEVDWVSSEAWLDFMKEHQLIHTMWSVSDKREGASMLVPRAASDGGWTDRDLTTSGLYAREIIRTWDTD
ncbi:MAG: glycoside hydrolase family 5 protein [Hyphomonadaceae bacterium]